MLSDMRRSLLVTLTLALFTSAPVFAQSPAADAARWKPLQFLLGSWEAATSGNDVKSSGTYTFQIELNGTVLARHSSADTCKGPSGFNCEHHDLLYLFHEAATGTDDNGIRAIYFDGEGHVLHYRVSTPTATSVMFQSEPAPGPQFRLTYELAGGVMKGKFQVQPPGQTEYHSYLEWSGGKK